MKERPAMWLGNGEALLGGKEVTEGEAAARRKRPAMWLGNSEVLLGGEERRSDRHYRQLLAKFHSGVINESQTRTQQGKTAASMRLVSPRNISETLSKGEEARTIDAAARRIKFSYEMKVDLAGVNSGVTDEGYLFIKEVIVLTAGVYKNVAYEDVVIDERMIANTDWGLMEMKPITWGHVELDVYNHLGNARGMVRGAKVVDGQVIASLLITDYALAEAIKKGEYQSVSLSHCYDIMENKIIYVNHLAVVLEGQVQEAKIKLENKENKMENNNTTETLLREKINLEKQNEELREKLMKLEQSANEEEVESKIAHEVKKQTEETEKKLTSLYEAKLALLDEARDLGVDRTNDMNLLKKQIASKKTDLIKKVLGSEVLDGMNEDQVNALYKTASKLQEKNDLASKNKNTFSKGYSKGYTGVEVSPGSIIQQKATGKDTGQQ